ncbi:MAG: amylo-alpha-1,6-glucosidase [Gemmatimonadales bacterium]
MNPAPSGSVTAEWLEADGLGGFASGTVPGPRARRYHGLLTVATTPPTGRQMLVSGFDAWIESTGSDGNSPAPEYLTVQRYHPDYQSRSADHLGEFSVDPWPTWTFRLSDGTVIEHDVFVPRDRSIVVLRWRLARPVAGKRLVVRPFLSGRDIHALHHENAAFRFDAVEAHQRVRWQPYPHLPAVVSLHNGSYRHAPDWYRGFQLDEERARGFDYLEDAGSPGLLSWDLAAGDAVWVVAADEPGNHADLELDALGTADRLRRRERLRRGRLGEALARAGDAYLVRRGTGKTIIAGYPWFADWGRDTFIAVRGLCLATGRLEDARAILLAWADAVSEGMLPNRFVDQGDQPEFNSVDASLWYVTVVGELVAAFEAAGRRLAVRDRARLEDAAQAILDGYARGTRFGIHADADGLLAAGVPGVQLTWMDAKVGDWVVTPRVGKPVEVQALWLAALEVGGQRDRRWRVAADRVREAFPARFWNPERSCLYDVVDCDGVAGRVDGSIRPNQIFAVGGLPHPLVTGRMATSVVDTVERDLLTPLGLRTLAPSDPGYLGHYQGGPRERDGAYHQGTAWPWLLGPFVEAWLRIRGNTGATRQEARARFLAPLLAHLGTAGLGHISEIVDADPPHTPRGCPFQAWSVGEALRIDHLLGGSMKPAPKRRVAAVG